MIIRLAKIIFSETVIINILSPVRCNEYLKIVQEDDIHAQGRAARVMG